MRTVTTPSYFARASQRRRARRPPPRAARPGPASPYSRGGKRRGQQWPPPGVSFEEPEPVYEPAAPSTPGADFNDWQFEYIKYHLAPKLARREVDLAAARRMEASARGRRHLRDMRR